MLRRWLAWPLLLVLAPAAPAPAATSLWFVEAAPGAGLDLFRHAGGGDDASYAQFMGAGACWADFDLDGYPDLALTNGRYRDVNETVQRAPRNALFRNEGDGTFADVTEGSGVGLSLWGQGCSAGDHDGDGDPDLFLAAYGVYVLLRNDGDFVFTNVSAAAGVTAEGKCGATPCFGIHGAWQDYDRDGDLDLYAINYVAWDFTTEPGGGPVAYAGQPNVLFRNEGLGSFTDVTAASNADGDPAWDHNKALGVAWFDYDRDGFPDLYLASDLAPNMLLHNEGDGTFKDATPGSGLADARSSMGLDAGWGDGDALPDLYFTHYRGEHNGYYRNDGDGTFTDRSGEGGLAADFPYVGWGTAFADLDGDGDSDLLAANGQTPPYVRRDLGGGEPTLLFVNRGDGSFDDASRVAGDAVREARVSRGLALADYDWDGDLDVLVANNDEEAPQLLENRGAQGNWLLLDLRGAGGNTGAVGAEVTAATPSGRALHERVEAGSSYQSQHMATVHLGLGDEATVANLEVRWPDGASQSFAGLAAGQLLRLTQGSAAVLDDTLSPRTSLLLEGPEGENGWFRGPVTATLAAEDRGVTRRAGIDRLLHRVDDGPWLPYPGPLPFDEGAHELDYRAWDREGNRESLRRADVRIDSQPPATSLALSGLPAAGGWYHSEVLVGLEAFDGGSGVAGTALSLDGGPWRDYGEPFLLGEEGWHDLAYRSRDAAGNVEAARLRSFGVDLAPPRTALSVQGPQAVRGGALLVTSEAVLALDARDSGAGVQRSETRLAGGDWAPYDGPFPLTGPDGPRDLEFRSVDGSGRVEAAQSARLWLDNEQGPPVLFANPRPDHLHVGEHAAPLDPARLGFTRVPWPPLFARGPASGLVVLAGAVPVEASALPDPSGIAGMRLRLDGAPLADAAGDSVDAVVDAAALRAGWHLLEGEAWDGRGNRAASELWFYALPTDARGAAATAADPPHNDLREPGT